MWKNVRTNFERITPNEVNYYKEWKVKTVWKKSIFKLAYDSIQPGNEIWYSGGENNEITTKEITKQLKKIQLEELRREANKFIDKEDTDLEFTILSFNGSTCEIWISCPNKPKSTLKFIEIFNRKWNW